MGMISGTSLMNAGIAGATVALVYKYRPIGQFVGGGMTESVANIAAGALIFGYAPEMGGVGNAVGTGFMVAGFAQLIASFVP